MIVFIKSDLKSKHKKQRYHNGVFTYFYNGPSCAIMIDSEKHLNEVIKLLNKLITIS